LRNGDCERLCLTEKIKDCWQRQTETPSQFTDSGDLRGSGRKDVDLHCFSYAYGNMDSGTPATVRAFAPDMALLLPGREPDL